MNNSGFQVAPSRLVTSPGARFGAALIVAFAGSAFGQAESQPAQSPPPATQETTVRVGASGVRPAAPQQAQANTNQQPEAKALLEKSRDAIAAAKTLEFDLFAPQIGLMGGDRSPKDVKAHMILTRADTGGWIMRITGHGMVAKETAPTEFDVVWDRQAITWVDQQAKTVYTRPFGQAKNFRGLQMINGLRIPSISGDRPLGEELAQTVMQLQGTEDIGGVPCDVVVTGTALEGQGSRKKVWIAKTDSIPRKLENIIDSKLISASTSVEFTNMKVNETIPPERATITPPDGFAIDKAEPAVHKPVKLDKLAVPDFELSSPDGSKVSKASLAGNVAVIQFWGTWSNPSKRSHAELQALADSYKEKGVKFFIASVREKDAEGVAAYLKEANVALPVLLEADSLAERLDVQSVPTVVVIGADGANVRMVSNYLKESTMKEVGEGIETALKDASDKKAAEAAAPAPQTAPAPQGDSKPADK
ncbi:MAG: redoxin family protein [Planctomycetes bacterium]|nr:redoxin family protein [Planctomycetota bacterium]